MHGVGEVSQLVISSGKKEVQIIQIQWTVAKCVTLNTIMLTIIVASYSVWA